MKDAGVTSLPMPIDKRGEARHSAEEAREMCGSTKSADGAYVIDGEVCLHEHFLCLIKTIVAQVFTGGCVCLLLEQSEETGARIADML